MAYIQHAQGTLQIVVRMSRFPWGRWSSPVVVFDGVNLSYKADAGNNTAGGQFVNLRLVDRRRWRDIQAAARGLRIRSLEVRNAEGLDRVLTALAQEHNDGLIVATDPFLFAHRTRIVEAANQQKLAAVYGFREFVETGGLLS